MFYKLLFLFFHFCILLCEFFVACKTFWLQMAVQVEKDFITAKAAYHYIVSSVMWYNRYNDLGPSESEGLIWGRWRVYKRWRMRNWTRRIRSHPYIIGFLHGSSSSFVNMIMRKSSVVNNVDLISNYELKRLC